MSTVCFWGGNAVQIIFAHIATKSIRKIIPPNFTYALRQKFNYKYRVDPD